MICNKALKITNKDIIYAQINRGYLDNWELNLYLKFGDEERHVGNISLPTNFDLNCKWYRINSFLFYTSTEAQAFAEANKHRDNRFRLIDLEDEVYTAINLAENE